MPFHRGLLQFAKKEVSLLPETIRQLPGAFRETAVSAFNLDIPPFIRERKIFPKPIREPLRKATEFLKPESKLEELAFMVPIGGAATKITKPVKQPLFSGLKDLSIGVIEELKGRTTVSKEFIRNLAVPKRGVKQPEIDIITEVLEEVPNTVPIKLFAEKIQGKLLPLETTTGFTEAGRRARSPRFESTTLPDEVRGNIAKYDEHIYGSPIKNSAGEIHFSGEGIDNYFAHTRIEDLAGKRLGKVEELGPELLNKKGFSGQKGDFGTVIHGSGDTRRIIEIQSDLFQKGRLEEAIRKPGLAEGVSRDLPIELLPKEMQKGLSQLEPFRNIWHERIIREEIKRAAIDGKTKLQFPTGETIMKIEGLGETANWISKEIKTLNAPLTDELLKVGKAVRNRADNSDWIITDVLGEGRFKAVPKNVSESIKSWRIIEDITTGGDKVFIAVNDFTGERVSGATRKFAKDIIDTQKENALRLQSEAFDISGRIDKTNAQFIRYEKIFGNFLKKIRKDLRRITDPQGVEWFETTIGPQDARKPIEAFAGVPFIIPQEQRSEEKFIINQ